MKELDFGIEEKTFDESVGLLMTYRCNLNCKYCYVHTKRHKDMSLEMAKAILKPFLLKKQGMINIAFLGGETLLAIDVIRPLVEWVETEKWNRLFRFFGSTNGTLLDNELKKWLSKHNRHITLGLSYDGNPSAQVNNRGNNSIDLDFFIKTWPNQPIQMTINTETVHQMASGVIYLLSRGAKVHPNVAFEEFEWTDDAIKEYEKQLNILVYFYNKYNKLPNITQFVHDLNEYANNIDNPKPQLRACGAGDGFQVFDVDGLSYPCHILSPLVLEGEKLQFVKNGLVSDTTNFADSDCVTCPYTTACPSCMGCNFLYRGTLQKRDKTHCKIMKTEVMTFIKKEALRLKAKDKLTAKDKEEIESMKKLIDYDKGITIKGL